MEITLRKPVIKKLAVLAALVILSLLAFSLNAVAVTTDQNIDVTFLKADGSGTSMADAAVNGDASYSINDQTLTIPLKPIQVGPITGYVTGITVQLAGGPVTVSTAQTAPYTATTVSIPIPSGEVQDQAQFDVTFDIYMSTGSHGTADAIMNFDFVN
ncbi:hypothetical protein Sgly_1480 [Syntrophobotulus glycolicus DSM 8271]|uniref:NEAT domain-containing protein n=2 Tax=Syntrophobotulus TaxID=51196 RepID=F0SWZ8_SYNGF|nr:hypothetical protein Sgly_1480 [Syntrophobotulus glycolicus DSM 8271]